MPDNPEVHSIWQHYNGCEYRVLMLTNLTSTNLKYKPTVVYESLLSGAYYSRELSDWHRSMTKISEE